MDASAILEVTRTLIGATEPYGDSGIDRERTKNLDKLIYVVDELLYDVEKAAFCKDRYEGSMRMMGEKANKALNDWWSWRIEDYLKESGEWKKVESERSKNNILGYISSGVNCFADLLVLKERNLWRVLCWIYIALHSAVVDYRKTGRR